MNEIRIWYGLRTRFYFSAIVEINKDLIFEFKYYMNIKEAFACFDNNLNFRKISNRSVLIAPIINNSHNLYSWRVRFAAK